MNLYITSPQSYQGHISSINCNQLFWCLSNQIKAHLKEAVTVSIKHVNNDYSVYVNVCININPDEFRHVIEIYDFPALFKTDDLLDAFTEYRCEHRV